MERIIENSWFRTVVVSKGTIVTLFSGELFKTKKNYRKNLYEILDYINKPNANKVHLIFDYTCCNANKRGDIDWAFRFRIGHMLKCIYSNNPNVRVIIHVYSELLPVFKDIEYVKKDLHYIPRVVTDIDYSQPLYFQIGKYNYVKIICKHDKFIYTIVDKMYD